MEPLENSTTSSTGSTSGSSTGTPQPGTTGKDSIAPGPQSPQQLQSPAQPQTEQPPAAEPLTTFLPDLPRPAQRTNRWVWLAVSTLMTLTAIGFAGCGVLLFFFGPQIETSHEQVLAAARKIVSFDPPPGFRGTLAETIDYRFALFRSARFEHESGRGVLILAEVRLIGPPNQQVEAMKSLLDRVSREIRTLDRPERVSRNHTLGQHTVVFDLLTGEDLASTTRYSQLTGEFPVPPGVGRVWLQLETDLWKEPEIDQFIASLAPAAAASTPAPVTGEPAATTDPEAKRIPADLPPPE